jgi:hypothetical protein
VIDRSGSMVFYGYEAATRAASKQFVDLLGVDDHYGIVSFGDTGLVEYPSGPMPSLQAIAGQATRDAGKAEIDGIGFGGCMTSSAVLHFDATAGAIGFPPSPGSPALMIIHMIDSPVLSIISWANVSLPSLAIESLSGLSARL